MNIINLPYFNDEINEHLVSYLKGNHIIESDEEILNLEKFNGGNMNFVMRVITNNKSFILKQAKPWVEKYPQVPAPINRTITEATFYNKIKTNVILTNFSPRLLLLDASNNVLILEDLGVTEDFSNLYQNQKQITFDEAKDLMFYLNELHEYQTDDYPSNQDMKILNHNHIFNYPFLNDNGFDLNTILEGLQEAALPFKEDTELKKKIIGLGHIYMQDNGKCLLHGDYYPGSWLKTNNGIKIIDPEFSFKGCPEFELGVFLAHMYITFHDQEFIENTLSLYKKANEIDRLLVNGFAGVEILRRLIGLAQLPIKLDLDQRKVLLAFAKKLIE